MDTLLTENGYNKALKELEELKKMRPEVANEIASAAALGDLSENAEYKSAREKQSILEVKIGELEQILVNAKVINVQTIKSDTIKFGAKVKILDVKSDKEFVYQIVGDYESDLKNNLISINSPIARALIGKTVGDSIEVKTPGGVKMFSVEEVLYN